MAYTSAPLRDVNSFRLLHLESGYGSTPLKAHLTSYQLGDHSSYDALSYAWGEPDTTELLLVNDEEVKISKNLHTILLQIRYTDRVRTCWIDAICINQQDGIEKGQQVSLMGQMYQHADTVLCWLGELSTHRLWALKFLQALAEEALRYIKPECDLENFWIISHDKLLPGVDANMVVGAVMDAHVVAIYDSDWFTRLWIVQELALAQNPKIICGAYDLSWEEFELATRVIMSCLRNCSHESKLKILVSMESAWDTISLRAQHLLNIRTAHPVVFQIDQAWSIGGSLAWRLRNRKCKDDRDRVYALLSLTTRGNSFKVFAPDPFIPDYTRPVEWAYHQFWRRFGGYTSLFYAGLSRRRDHSMKESNVAINEGISFCFDGHCLPSWVPDLRRHHAKEWDPVFDLDYATSNPFQHMGASFKDGPGILTIRGHRFDVVMRAFPLIQLNGLCQTLEDVCILRTTIKFYLSFESEHEAYPNGQAWIEALGSALMTDMPYDHSHPFQRYFDTCQPITNLSDTELRRIWKLYVDLLLADTGYVWKKFCSVALSRKVLQFNPFAELTYDGRLVWMLHNYLGKVLQAHRLIITERGYMGLAPPDTAVGDVVVVIGGPSVPFVVRDTSVHGFGELIADETHGTLVPDGTGRRLSQLLGPCYLQGIMRAELWENEGDSVGVEWETDKLGTLPKPTLWLI